MFCQEVADLTHHTQGRRVELDWASCFTTLFWAIVKRRANRRAHTK